MFAGAKEAHTVSPHFVQLLYYGLVSCGFMAPLHFSKSQFASLTGSFVKNKPISILLWVSATIISFLSVHYFRFGFDYIKDLEFAKCTIPLY